MSRRNFSSASSTCLRFRRRSSASIWIEVPHLGQVSVGFSSSRAMLSSICSPHFGHGNGIFTSQFSIFKNVKGFGLVCQVNNYPKKAGKPLSFNAPPDSDLPAAPEEGEAEQDSSRHAVAPRTSHPRGKSKWCWISPTGYCGIEFRSSNCTRRAAHQFGKRSVCYTLGG